MNDDAAAPGGGSARGVLSARRLLWGIPALLYALFVLWYTNTQGALSPEEIEAFATVMAANGAPPEQMATLRRFMEEDTGRQFLMVNLIDMRDTPGQVPGEPPAGSAEESMARYMAHMFPQLFQRACHPAFSGSAVSRSVDLYGIEGAEVWDRAALMRYRSRRDLMEIALHPAMSHEHDFKIAALEKTIAFPVETELYPGDPRLLLALVLLAGVALADLVLFRRRTAA